MGKVLVNRDKDGLALQGYDPVGYFTESKPVKGNPKHRVKYHGAIYQFASAQNKEMFERTPATYEPQFGGYCGYAASINKISPISPEYWQILDGRLVLQHNQRAWDAWIKDVPGNLRKANANWPALVQRNGTGGDRTLVNVNKKGVALDGHDPVAYFTENKPVKGDSGHQAVYNGAIYYFASKENREVFEKDPAKYAPAFGGFCGYAASIKRVRPVNVEIFQIQNDRLVLQHTPKAYRLWNQNPQESEQRADMNWPGLVQQKGK